MKKKNKKTKKKNLNMKSIHWYVIIYDFLMCIVFNITGRVMREILVDGYTLHSKFIGCNVKKKLKASNERGFFHSFFLLKRRIRKVHFEHNAFVKKTIGLMHSHSSVMTVYIWPHFNQPYVLVFQAFLTSISKQYCSFFVSENLLKNVQKCI